MTRAGVVTLVALVALAGVAHAAPAPHANPITTAAVVPASGPPDSAVAEAADANLESIEARRGLTFDVAVGGGLLFGIGIKDSVGRGPGVSLRLGHVATRRTVITFEISTTAALHKSATMSDTEADASANLLAGARTYVNPSLWLRVAGGVGVFEGRKLLRDDGTLEGIRLVGPALLGGVGIDVARFKWAVLSVEVATSAMINREGVLVASGLHVGLSFD
jgi:hypothetical protein